MAYGNPADEYAAAYQRGKAVTTEDVRVRGDVRRLTNVIENGSLLLVEMAGKEPANVVFSAVARQASADKGGGRAETESLSVALPMHWLNPS